MLAAYVAEFVADPGVVLVSGAEQFIDEAGAAARTARSTSVTVTTCSCERDRYVLDHAELVRLSLRNGQGFGEPSAVMFRRSVFDAIGGYDPSFEHAADVDFNLRASALGPSVYLRHPYLRRRWHAGRPDPHQPRDPARSRATGCGSTSATATRDGSDRARPRRGPFRARVALASTTPLAAARARQWPVARLALDNLRVGVRAPVAGARRSRRGDRAAPQPRRAVSPALPGSASGGQRFWHDGQSDGSISGNVGERARARSSASVGDERVADARRRARSAALRDVGAVLQQRGRRLEVVEADELERAAQLTARIETAPLVLQHEQRVAVEVGEDAPQLLAVRVLFATPSSVTIAWCGARALQVVRDAGAEPVEAGRGGSRGSSRRAPPRAGAPGVQKSTM